MEYYLGNCKNNALVTGTQRICVSWGNTVGIFRTDPDFSFADEATALAYANWETAIQDELIYPFPEIAQEDVNDADAVNQEFANGLTEVTPGKINRTYTIISNPYIDKQLRSHNGLKSAIYKIDNNGNVRGIVGDNGEFLPIPVQLFQVQKPTENNGADAGFTTKVLIVISDVETYINKAAIIESGNMDFNAKIVKGLEPVQLSIVGTPTATTLTVKAVISGTTNPVTGLSEVIGDDWTIQSDAGVENAPNTITDNGDGTYDFDFTALVTGSTVNLIDPSDMATPGYKSNGAKTITF
ncbi:MAG: hypothetical protein ACOWWH_12645 [Eubacteriaceae bacterium]